MSCKCDNTLGNTGTPNCQPIMSVMRGIVVVPYFDSVGVINYITLADTLNATYFTAKLNQVDGSKRWLPIQNIKNVTSTKGDSTFETFEDQSKIFIQEGVRSFAGLLAKQSPNYLKKIKDYRCTEIGIFIIDKDGNLIGMNKESGKLHPIRVDNESWNPTLALGTDKETQKILLAFDFDINEKDENLEMITASDLTGVDLLALQGLLDVNAAFSAITTAGFTATLTYDYGSILHKNKVKGLVTADFVSSVGGATSKIRSVTDAADKAITVTETADGVYAVVFGVAQDTTDVLQPVAKKNGFDFSNWATVTIP